MHFPNLFILFSLVNPNEPFTPPFQAPFSTHIVGEKPIIVSHFHFISTLNSWVFLSFLIALIFCQYYLHYAYYIHSYLFSFRYLLDSFNSFCLFGCLALVLIGNLDHLNFFCWWVEFCLLNCRRLGISYIRHCMIRTMGTSPRGQGLLVCLRGA